MKLLASLPKKHKKNEVLDKYCRGNGIGYIPIPALFTLFSRFRFGTNVLSAILSC